MVAHLVRLKLALLRNGLRRQPVQLIGMLIGGAYALGGTIVALLGLVGARTASDTTLVSAILTLAGAGLLLAWVLVPIMAFGTDPTLDPGRFATFSVPNRQLAVGLIVTALLGVPGAATAVVTLAAVLPWTRSVGATLVALAGSLLGLATAILGSRVATGLAAALLRTRRGRESMIMLWTVAMLGYFAVVPRFSSGQHPSKEEIVSLGGIVGWTPLGWAWSAPGRLVAGDPVGALLRLVFAAVLVAGLLWVWVRLVATAQTNPRAAVAPPSNGDGGGLGWFERLPATPAGTITARVLTYWRRDPRYRVGMILMPVMPLVVALSTSSQSGPGTFFIAPVMLAFLVGLGPHNDVSYDGSAIWLHVAAGVSGYADRLARLVPYVVMAVLLEPVYLVLACSHSQRWDLLGPVAGLVTVTALSTWGVSSSINVLMPYRAPEPGENPYTVAPGSAGMAMAAQLVTMAVTGVVVTPVAVLTLWQGLGSPPSWVGPTAGLSGLVIGVVVLAVGVRVGGTHLMRNGDKVLARMVRNQQR